MFSAICTWINDWVNNRWTGDLRRHRARYDVNVMIKLLSIDKCLKETTLILGNIWLFKRRCRLFNCVQSYLMKVPLLYARVQLNICVPMFLHYSDVKMSAMASQLTSLTIVYSNIYTGAVQRKQQSSASLAFVRAIRRWPANSPHKGPVTR